MNPESDYFYQSSPASIAKLSAPELNLILDDPFNISINKSRTVSFYNADGDFNANMLDDYIKLLIDHCHQSSTVKPIDITRNINDSQIVSQNQFEYKQKMIQFDASKSEKIQIKCQPRAKFRPRTEKESKDSSHFIRCEENIRPEYPTIYIPEIWATESTENIIQVTLVGIDKQPHPYTIDNKERKCLSADRPLIFKEQEVNTLYFRLTDQDYQNKEKMFLIEYIKSKQNGVITKDLIKKRQLNQSMLRFTRFYQINKETYEQDIASTEYSSIMSEDYGDFDIADIFPLYGPMFGNQKVCVEIKGHIPKDFKRNFIINITGNGIIWSHRVDSIKKTGNNITFFMPPFPYTDTNRAQVNIIIEYKHEKIYRLSYLYSRQLDEDLVEPNLNESSMIVAQLSLSNRCNVLNSNEAISAFPISSSIENVYQDQGVKRLRQ